ncbi:MAG: AAA family ATPase, partial [SAR324 cluster bacterium]|nr:AAA family ATPase [SAR324 cluster bacterium]
MFGPRGTGKSTLLRQYFPEALWIDLLDPREQRIFRAHPEHLIERLMGDPERTVVIDEIQKVPTLLDVIHRLIEEQKNVRFVLTGSSARKLRRGASNLLAGRL